MHSRFSDRWVTAVLAVVAWTMVAMPVALAEYQPARSAPSSRGGVTDRVIVGFRTDTLADTAAMHAEISALSGRVDLPLRAVDRLGDGLAVVRLAMPATVSKALTPTLPP